MDVQITLDLQILKKRLCPECRKTMDRYLKELAIEALQKDTEKKET